MPSYHGPYINSSNRHTNPVKEQRASTTDGKVIWQAVQAYFTTKYGHLPASLDHPDILQSVKDISKEYEDFKPKVPTG